jgi:hypothetical protein
MNAKSGILSISTMFLFLAFTATSNIPSAAGIGNPEKVAAQKAEEPDASKSSSKLDPKPQAIQLGGGKTMFMAIDADSAGVWRTSGVISQIQERFDSDLVTPVKAESGTGSSVSKLAGFQATRLYRNKVNEIEAVSMIYREDGWMEPPILSTAKENRTAALPLVGGKSALLVKNRWGKLPICAGIYDSDLIQAKPEGLEAIELRRIRKDDVVMTFSILYRNSGTVDPPQETWIGIGKGEIENRTQVLELAGGESAFLVANPQGKHPRLKGIYPDNQIKQLQPSSKGILVTEQYLAIGGEILSLDILNAPDQSAKFVGGCLGAKPIQNQNQVIKLAGGKTAVFSVNPGSTNSMPNFAGIRVPIKGGQTVNPQAPPKTPAK